MARIDRAASAHHPLLADFVALNDPDRRRALERSGAYFVVEGHLALERLLGQPEWEIRAIALLPRAAERLRPKLDAVDAAAVVAEEEVLRAVVGFDLHRGVLASVQRRPTPRVADVGLPSTGLLLAAQGINDHENLGALYRNAAAFGAAAVALDARCADPFYRRTVRVSLGHVLAVPTLATAPGATGIEELRAAGATVVALTPSGDVGLREVHLGPLRTRPIAVVVGAEGPGLDADAIAAADLRVRIEMVPGIDSLNVSVAAAVTLHHLCASLGPPADDRRDQ
jgi:tRNA G18 (ribose-2'-O)-methylase SpoU